MPQTASVNTRSLQTESLSADEDRLINDVLLNAGVVDVAGGSFQVTEDTGANMQVSVGSGSAGDKAVTKNADRVYIGEHENASQLLALSASDPSDDRIDLVVFRTYDDEADSSGNTYSDIEIVEGTPAGSPSAPAVPAGAIALAEVLVQASVSAITDGDITDRRAESKVRYETIDLPATRRHRTSGQTISDSSATTINWNGNVFTFGDSFAHAAGVFTIPRAGVVAVTVFVSWASNGTGRRRALIRKNSGTVAGENVSAASAGSTDQSPSVVIDVAAGDTIDVTGLQNSGGNLDVLTGSAISIAYLRAAV